MEELDKILKEKQEEARKMAEELEVEVDPETRKRWWKKLSQHEGTKSRGATSAEWELIKQMKSFKLARELYIVEKKLGNDHEMPQEMLEYGRKHAPLDRLCLKFDIIFALVKEYYRVIDDYSKEWGKNIELIEEIKDKNKKIKEMEEKIEEIEKEMKQRTIQGKGKVSRLSRKDIEEIEIRKEKGEKYSEMYQEYGYKKAKYFRNAIRNATNKKTLNYKGEWGK